MRNSQISYTRQNKALFWIILAAITILITLLSLFAGSVRLSPEEVLAVICGRDKASTAAKIILYTRLPRTFASLLSGAAFSVSGVVIQTVLNNPLASPGIIGVNSSAGFAVALGCAIFPAAQKYSPFIAFAGALFGVLLVLTLAEKTGASRMTVILAGIAISNLFSAGIDAIVTLIPDALMGVSDFRIGGFTSVTMEQLKPAAVLILAGLLFVFSMSTQLDILSLGTDTAYSLGLSVKNVRFLLLVSAAILAGAAVSFSGLLSFVGLIVPHTMRRIKGNDGLSLLVSCALGGAFFVTLCDLLSRILFAPFELPVGIVLSFSGVPFFLWILFKKRGGHA